MVIELKTKRLILRKPKLSDLDDLFEGINNINIAKNLLVVHFPYTKKEEKEFIKKCIEKWSKKEKTDYPFVIELKSEKKAIGTISLHRVDTFQGTAETGSWINEKYWKKGYITEAKIAVNEFAFNKLKLRKLISKVYTNNIASNKTQQGCGYKLEGTFKKHVICKATGIIHDENVYGLFKEDWKKNLPKLKKHLDKKIKSLK
jgi:[ribosomal protein S5]-alanine N-acetyltransferase